MKEEDNQQNSKHLFPIPEILFFLTLVFGTIPVSSGPGASIEGLDKLVHFANYLLLGLFWQKRLGLIKNVLLGSGLGASIEIIQYFLPYRSFELADILANCLGCLLGAGLGVFLTAKIGRGNRQKKSQ